MNRPDGMENEHLPRDTRQPFLNLDDSKQTRSNYGSCWLCSEETWSQASPRCSMSHRDPSTVQVCWGGSQVASQKATIFVTAFCLQEIIPFPRCTVSEGWLDCCCPRLQFPVKTSHEVPDNQGIASVSAGFWPRSKSWPPAPYSSQTVLVSNQPASPCSLCSANTSTKPSLPPAPLSIICSLNDAGSQPKTSCLDVVSDSQTQPHKLGFGVNGTCELSGAEARLCVLCSVPLVVQSWQMRQPIYRDLLSLSSLQPARHSSSCPAARGQCCTTSKKYQLAGTSGKKWQLKSRCKYMARITACMNPPSIPKEPAGLACLMQVVSMCLGPGRSPLLTPAVGHLLQL